MLRRVLAAVMVAFVFTVTGSAGAATAAPTDPGGWCSTSPTPVGNAETLAGAIDLGAPPSTTQGGGTYTRTGWAGWGSPHIYDPGCAEKLKQWIAGKLTDGPASALLKDDPYNTVAGWYLGGAAFVGSALTLLIRVATEPGVIWDALNVGEDAARAAAGWHVYATWITVTFLAVGAWFLARARKDSLGTVWSQNMTALLMLTAGLLVAAYQVSVGPSVDGAIQSTFKASGQVATDAPSPSAAFADTYIDGILLPGWAAVHLGGDMDAVKEFGPRLYAAATMTRAEEAAVKSDPDAKKRLIEEKDRNYRQVAGEIQAKYPNAYDHLAGRPDTRDSRMGWAMLVFLLVLPVAVVVGVLAGAVAFARIALRYSFAVWPGVSVIVAHPLLQQWGRVFATEVVKWLWVGCLSVAAMVAYLRVIIGIVNAPEEIPWAGRMIAAVTLSLFLIWVWKKKRHDLIRKAGLEREAALARWAAKATRDAVHRDRSDSKPDPERRPAERGAAPATTDAPTVDHVASPHEGLSRPDAAPQAPDAAEGAVREVAAARAARKADDVARAVDSTRVPPKAATTDVSSAAARLSSSRPSETTLARREAAALTARTAHALPAKKATATTTTVQATSRSAVRVAASRMSKRVAAPTATLTGGPAAGAVTRVAAAAAKIRRAR